MKDVSTRTRPDAVAYIAMATGFFAVGAVAVGAIAIGSMAIGSLAIKKVRLRDVQIDTLTVRRLLVLEGDSPSTAAASSAPDALETNGEVRPRPAPRRRRPRKPITN